MIQNINEVEKETLKNVLNAAIISFKDAEYSDVTESYPADDYFTCYLPTKAHIKSLKTILKKLSNN